DLASRLALGMRAVGLAAFSIVARAQETNSAALAGECLAGYFCVGAYEPNRAPTTRRGSLCPYQLSRGAAPGRWCIVQPIGPEFGVLYAGGPRAHRVALLTTPSGRPIRVRRWRSVGTTAACRGKYFDGTDHQPSEQSGMSPNPPNPPPDFNCDSG